MPLGPVQRYPVGLTALLDFKGLSPPSQFSELVHGSLDLMQFYGQTQLQRRIANNPALAQGGAVTITVPGSEAWVLFSIQGAVTTTAPMTAVRVGLTLGQPTLQATFASSPANHFTPGVAANQGFAFLMPYPRLILPGSELGVTLEVLVGAANANVSLILQVGVLA